MQRKILVSIFKILLVCFIGFLFGFFTKNIFLSDANASEADVLSNEKTITNTDSVLNNIFPSDSYYSAYNEDTGVYHFTYKGNSKTRTSSTLYTKADALSLTKQLIRFKYDIKLTDDSRNGISYEEYQGDYPTGAYAGYVFSDEGYLLEAYYREGVIYDFDSSKMISYEKAYSMAVEAIADKYGEHINICGTFDSYEYELYYNPISKKICYYISDIVGNGHPSIDEVVFFATISTDGSYVDIAANIIAE